MPLVGIGHLTMLDVAPPNWVSLAHEAGFDAVGIQVADIGPTEEEWPMRLGSPMLAGTLRWMADTGDSGGGIIIDPLHLQRGGGRPPDVGSLDPKLIAYCQLCDAPLAAPGDLSAQ